MLQRFCNWLQVDETSFKKNISTIKLIKYILKKLKKKRFFHEIMISLFGSMTSLLSQMKNEHVIVQLEWLQKKVSHFCSAFFRFFLVYWNASEFHLNSSRNMNISRMKNKSLISGPEKILSITLAWHFYLRNADLISKISGDILTGYAHEVYATEVACGPHHENGRQEGTHLVQPLRYIFLGDF